MVWMTFIAWMKHTLCDELMIDTVPCRVLTENDKILGVDGIGQVLLKLQLGARVPSPVMKAYEKSRDDKGLACLGNMTEKMNATTDRFGQIVTRVINEKKMTDLYLNSGKYLGQRIKRFDVGTLALLLSAFSFFMSTTGLVVNGFRLNSAEARLQVMSEHIDKLNERQRTISNNVNYLFENNQFMGIEQDLMIDYINGIKTIYSCEYLNLFFDSIFSKLENRLKYVLDAIFARKLTHDIIDRYSLDELTSQSYFSDTIYLVNPSQLYDLGRLDPISYRDHSLTFMLSFPIIKRRYDFKSIKILESPQSLLLTKSGYELYHSFLIPANASLKNLSSVIDEIRSSRNCIKTNTFTACDGNSMIAHEEKLCILSLVNGIDQHCFRRNVHVFDFNVAYDNDHALIYLKENSRIENAQGKVSHVVRNDSEKCVYLNKQKGLLVRSNYREEKLFIDDMSFSVASKDIELSFTYMEPVFIENFSRPIFNRTNVFVPMNFNDPIPSEVLEIAAIAISSVVFLILLFMFICRFANCKRSQTVNANNLFPMASQS